MVASASWPGAGDLRGGSRPALDSPERSTTAPGWNAWSPPRRSCNARPGIGIKTDARDAAHLARLLRLGEITPVTVPAPEIEAVRDLVRARDDARADLMRVRHRLSKLLLRQGIVYSGGTPWTCGGPLPGDVFRPLVLVVIGHWLLPSRLCWRRHARSVRVLDRGARLEGEDRGNGFGLVAGYISERPNGAVSQFRAEPVGGTGWVGVGQDL